MIGRQKCAVKYKFRTLWWLGFAFPCAFSFVGLVLIWLIYLTPKYNLFAGVIWQPDFQTMEGLTHGQLPYGPWAAAGSKTIMVQFGKVRSVVARGNQGAEIVWPGKLGANTSWQTLAAQAGQCNIIVGLSGIYQEAEARENFDHLVQSSLDYIEKNAYLGQPFAWYFPVEIDPSWKDMPNLKKSLSALPRPLWISAYAGIKKAQHPRRIARWLLNNLPKDVGVLWQDGVGAHSRTLKNSVKLISALHEKLGTKRLIIITESFRTNHDKTTRPATGAELFDQIATYQKHFPQLQRYVFEGPKFFGWPQLLSLKFHIALFNRHSIYQSLEAKDKEGCI
ncbi:hypothetical protein [Polycladidibacter stylochi]|uniref:hypothetical protein n=1 Tax=Polycladidibacter stylochi TaxID=1807766 RepID=UPI00082B9657|nr:hypothetical protein [Pseudovibrio stylochi]